MRATQPNVLFFLYIFSHSLKCPAGKSNIHIGKEGYTTRTFSCTVSHRRKLLHTTMGSPGSLNDKTIVRFDKFINMIRNKEIYADVQFDLVDASGVSTRHKGAYVLCDGGYHAWRVMQCPVRTASDPKVLLWSRWLESLRKDVECFFGILKTRFRILKFGIDMVEDASVDLLFRTCCALHNQLLELDGLNAEMEAYAQWDGECWDEMEWGTAANRDMMSDGMRRRLGGNNSFDSGSVGNVSQYADRRIIEEIELEIQMDPSYESFRRQLVDHFIHKHNNGELAWPRLNRHNAPARPAE